MKYSKSILVLMIINIFTALILIFIGHQTRNLEIINSSLIENIDKKKQEININQIEYSLHNDNKYLEKLFSIYQSETYQNNQTKVINLSEFSNYNNKKILKVKLK